MEVLKTANGNNRVILGANAQTAGIATVVGGTGRDTLSAAGYTAASGVVFLNADATDSLVGGAGVDTISSGTNFNMGLSSGVEVLELTGSATLGTGNSQDNWLVGGAGNDSLSGLDGNDTIEGQGGTDTFDGGAGNDVYIVDSTTDTIADASGTDTVRSSVSFDLSDAKVASGTGIEHLVYTSTLGGSLTGNAGDNSISGNDGNDTLEGKAGVDTLIGGAGDDRYIVDTTTDLIVDASGTDTVESNTSFDLSNTLVGGGNTIENLVYSGTGAATLTGNNLNNSLTGNDQNNTLEGMGGVDTLTGGAGNDVYIVDTTTDLIVDASGAADVVRSSVDFDLSNTLVAGGSGIEQLDLTGAAVSGTGNSVANIITGNSLANSLDGGAGADELIGGQGSDTYFVDNAGDVVTETDTTTLGGNDLVISSIDYTLGSNLERLALAGAATFGGGNELANTLTGNSLANRLDGGTGADSLVGGAGDDTYRVDNSGDTVFENANEGTDTVISRVSHTLSGNIENLTYEGSGSATLVGNALANTIVGNAQGNRLDGAAGADSLVGGAGNDTYVVDEAGDVLVEGAGAGTDVVESSINYTLAANFEQLVLTGTAVSGTGNSVANIITGNSLANSLDGGTGADQLIGGAGNDTYFVDNAGDVVSENASEGTDTVFSTVGHALSANVENLTYTGAANVSLSGNDDTVSGNLIDGSGAGTNTLIGGAGNDTLVVHADRLGTVVENASAGTDTIRLVGTNATLNNAAFNNIENYDLSLLTGQAAVTLGVNSSGLLSLTGTAGADTIRATVDIGSSTLDAGAGADQFVFNSQGDMDAASLIGGAGIDSLAFGSAIADLGDADFAKVSGVEFLSLSGTGNGATLGANAQAAGIATVLGGTGNDTLNASGYTVGIVLDASRNTGAGATGSTLVGGKAGDRLALSNHNVFNISSVVGGAGTDTLAFGENGISITDDKFASNLVDVEFLQTKDGTNYLQVGPNAAASGLKTLVGGAGSDTFDASAFTTGMAIDAGAAADSITLQSTATVGLSTVAGGVGADTLTISQAGTLADTALANVTGIEVLRAASTGASNISIGQNAKAGGLQQVVGGSSNDILNASEFVGAVTLTGGEGDDSLVVSTGDNLRSQNMQGGTGTDTLSFAIDQLSVTDADFVGVSSVEVLKTANGNNRVILGTNALTAGIATLEGGSGNDTLSVTAYTNAATVMGGEGDDSLLGGAAIDSLVGGSGNDTFVITNGATAISEQAAGGTDLVLSSASHTLNAEVENLQLTGSSNIDGTGNSSANSITGNDGNNRLDGLAGADTLQGGAGDDTLAYDPADALVDGGSGSNTLETTVTLSLGALPGVVFSNLQNILLAGSASIHATGNASSNSVTGNSAANSLDGAGGADTLIGAAGNDTLIVDASDTLIDGGADTDWARSEVSVDLADGRFTAVENVELAGVSQINALGDAQANTLIGNATDNTLDGRGGADSMVGGLGNDTYFVDSTADTTIEAIAEGTDRVVSTTTWQLAANIEILELSGSLAIDGTGNELDNSLLGNEQSNSLFGGDGQDTLVGNGGADYLDGQAGLNTLIGGTGNDTYVINGEDDVIDEQGGAGDVDTVLANASFALSAGLENLIMSGSGDFVGWGNLLDNSLIGNSGNNNLIGYSGNDTLDGQAGNDTMAGGAGNDVYFVDSLTDIITENLNQGTDEVRSSVTWTLANNFERLFLTGAGAIHGTGNSLDNTLVGNDQANTLDGTSGNNSLFGNGGNDTLIALTGDDTLDGGDGNDSLSAGSGANSLLGGIGNDTLVGTTGNDTFLGGDGNDSLNAGDGNNSLLGGSGLDTIVSGTGEDFLDGGDDNDSLVGGSGNDTLLGGAGNDLINGGLGADSLVGGAGNDSYLVDDAGDVVIENTTGTLGGTDLVTSSVDFILGLNVENLVLQDTFGNLSGTGNASANSLVGNNGNNSLFGFAGRDTLLGNTGNDTLDGGDLEDALFGGIGNDLLIGGSGSDVLNGTSAAAAGANEIDTLTGGGSQGDLFVLGDGSTVYYNTAANGVDYAYLTDFSLTENDQLQLRDLSTGAHANTVNGYLVGSQIYGAIGTANSYLYRDTNNNGVINAGDNLIAAIVATGGSGAGGSLQTSDLNTIGIFV